VGDAGRLRPRRSESDEEAQLTPQGKRASWSGNQLTHNENKWGTKLFNFFGMFTKKNKEQDVKKRSSQIKINLKWKLHV